MSRRRREQGEAVSLFPFLSILACVIGTLTLMIAALALGQIDEGESPEALDRIEQAKAMEEESLADEIDLDRIRRQISEAEKLLAELRRAEEEIARLKTAELDEQKAIADARDKTPELAELAELRKRVPELKLDIPELEKTIAELTKQIEEKGKPKEAEVVVRPGGTGFDLKPTFVEVTSTGVVINDGLEPAQLRRGDLNRENGRFHQLLDTVAGTPKGTIIFLVREDGIGTYNTAVHVCNTHYGPNGYATHGKLPIVGQGRIDLKLFEGK